MAGILAFSGFVPIVDGWQPQLEDRRATRAFIAHGRDDPIIEVGFARRARELLESGGLAVDYRESDVGHRSTPATFPTRPGGSPASRPLAPKIESDWNQTTWLWTVRLIVRCRVS